MKDYYLLQTPHKQHPLPNRTTHSTAGHAKKPQKIGKKCLNSVFTSVAEDASFESPKGSVKISSISEVSDENQLTESTEKQAISPSFEMVAQSDLTVMSSQISAEEGDNVSLNCYASEEWNDAKKGTVEVEMVVKHLRQAQTQVLNSVDADLQSKKLLDALIKAVIEEFYDLSEEDCFTELVSRNASLVISSFVLWIFAVAIFFFRSGVGSSFNGPLPT